VNLTSPTTDTNTARVFRHAADYLDRHGWTQGELFADVPTATPAACAVGAIVVATVGRPERLYASLALSDKQVRVIEHHTDLFTTYLTRNGFTSTFRCGVNLVGDWNDNPDRTPAGVANALRRAADWYEHNHPGVRP
jgi:hypothetical protein